MKSAYDILGISPDASDEEVKSAYRRFSKVLHPDINKRPTATQEFKELNNAYNTLIDPSERSKHDYALAVVETKDVEKDAVDSVLDNYSIDVPKKKKKKKKKKQKQAEEQALHQSQQVWVHPGYAPPRQTHNEGRGNGDFEHIPDGYDGHDDLGGIL